MEPVPKGPRANVRNMEAARAKKGGKPGGLGYDPKAGEEHASATYREDGETDVFALVGQRGYSEDRFYTRSVNSHNHGEKLSIRVPQGFDSQLHAIVREVSEYRHMNDLIRDALVHRAEYIQKRYKLTPETRRFLELERLRADSDRRAQDIELMTNTVTDIAFKLQAAWDAKDYGMLAEELEESSELVDWLREPYKSQVRQTLAEWHARSKDVVEQYRREQEED